MTTLKVLVLAGLTAVGLIRPDGHEVALLAREACACTTAACARGVSRKLDAALETISSDRVLEQVAPALADTAICLARHAL